MKILKQAKIFDAKNTLYYNLLQDDKGGIWISLSDFSKCMWKDKAPFQTSATAKKYTKMKDDEFIRYISDIIINQNLI